MFQAVNAVSYIHWNGYMHRDIKPENFLVQEKQSGSSYSTNNKQNTGKGNNW